MTEPAFDPIRAYLDNEKKLVFHEPDGLAHALRDGFFALRIPTTFDLAPGIKLAREFHLASICDGAEQATRYRGFKQIPRIYFDRETFQTEHILADAVQRQQWFPTAVSSMCDQMHELGRIILRTILGGMGIAPQLWSQVTGETSHGGGITWFAVSHYRPERNMPGTPAHKDTGFVTVLYCDQPGLEARIGGKWVDVRPVEGHFLINFGGSLELLTSKLPTKIAAVLHRVRQCSPLPNQEDRYSFAAFLNPPADGYLYAAEKGGRRAEPIISVEQFLRDFNERTWSDSYSDFGIAARQPSVADVSEN